MKVFYSSLIQETNTFCPKLTDISVFERGYYLRGAEIAPRLNGTNTEIGGFYTYFNDKEVEEVRWVPFDLTADFREKYVKPSLKKDNLTFEALKVWFESRGYL